MAAVAKGRGEKRGRGTGEKRREGRRAS